MTDAASKTAHKRGQPEPKDNYGVGYLYHHYPQYQAFAKQLATVGGQVDIYEVLGVQFNSDPDALARLTKELNKPITLHSYEYCLGNVEPPPQRIIDRIQMLAKTCNAAYIGEHLAIMGTENDYIGGFIQPLGTDEQTECMIANMKKAKAESVCPIIIENASQFFSQVGPKSIARQLKEVAEAADVGLLLSLSNISISDNFKPQDRDAFLAELPFERVRQLHLICGNTQEEQWPSMQKTRLEHEWGYKMMQELATDKNMNPSSILFELESGTPSFPKPEKLRDYMDEARSLFYSAKAAA